jgi:RHS repeat-associated protein
VPGAGWSYMVYDKKDRVVLQADDSDLAKGYWLFKKYDSMFRNIQSGTIHGFATTSRTTLQTAFDGLATNPYEDRGTGLYGYTNTSFPSAYAPVDTNIKTVIYFDDFLWNTDVAYNFQSANAFHAQGFNKGVMTGMLVRNLETREWYKFLNYVDYKGRIIQQYAQNHLGGIDRMDYQYRFNGEVLKMRMVHRKTGAKDLTELYEYSYNHTGAKISFTHNGLVVTKYEQDGINRLQNKKFRPAGTATGSSQTGNWTDATTWQSGVLPLANDNVTINTGHTLTIPSGQIVSAGILNDKGILKNFGTLNMGKYSTSDLYAQTFFYHIRGGLRGNNLDANGDLTNTLFSFKLEYEGNNGFFDGNIRNQYWKSSIDGIQRAYEYNYDKASRLKSGGYGSTKAGESYALNSVSYDFNGNITALSRNGYLSNNTFGLVDNLGYAYQMNSNKLLGVSDAVTGNLNTGDFRNGNTSGDDYEYWADGSLKKDLNKGISLIEYNYLKRPKKIDFSNGKWITYQYDAGGKKLKKTTSDGLTTDYVGNLIFENNMLYQISHDEGRIVNNIYEYNITDNLGNLRVAFKDSAGIAKITQAQDFDPFGLENWTSKYVNSTKSNYFKMNGKETDLQTGFNDLGNRNYNPTIGRLLSIDKVAPLYSSYSTYGYCLNNPVKYVDIEGNFVLDAETARKYPALAFMVNSVLPNLANNPEVLQALASTIDPFSPTNGKQQGIINMIKKYLVSGTGPNIKVTHPVSNQMFSGPEVNEEDSGHYDGNITSSERNNIYVNRIAVERLENVAKGYLKNNSSGGKFAAEMFNISHTITHEFAHFLLNAIYGDNGEDSKGQYYEAGDYFSGKAFKGNTFHAETSSKQEKPGTLQFYNSNRNTSLMRGLTAGNNLLIQFMILQNAESTSGTNKKKKGKGDGGSAYGGAH